MNKRPKILGYGNAYRFLGISHQRFDYLLKQNKIYFQNTSGGKVFFKEDLEAFQKSRTEQMKHGRR